MASNYFVQTQSPGVRVVSPTFVYDVQNVGVLTVPTGIYFEYPVQKDLWEQDSGAGLLEPIAAQIEQFVSEGFVVGANFLQDFDNNGLLTDYLDFIVQYVPPSGKLPPQQALVRVSVDSLGATDPAFVGLAGSPLSLISAAYDRLVATTQL